MTPQIHVNKPAQRVPVDAKARASVGGEGIVQHTFGRAQRVRVVPTWKVKDIVLPEPEKSSRVEERQAAKKERISDEERQVIIHHCVHSQKLMSVIPGDHGTSQISS
jgi:hypothetical protein